MTNFLEIFARELKRKHPVPERLALTLAGLAHPTLDVEHYLAELDRLAAVMRRSLFAQPAGRPRARQFLHVLNQELGFMGNREQYYDPANSFLNEVLERRTGLPIMLSLLCMAIGRRLGIDVTGMGFPGHFMARYGDEAGYWLLDPFHGEVLERDAVEDYLAQIFQRPVVLGPAAHTAVSAASLTQRILNNLRNVYLSRGNYAMTARVLDYLLILTPANDNLWQERGMLHYYSEQWDRAAYDLRRYFFLKGQLMLALGHEPNAELAQATLNQQDEQLLRVYKQIAERQARAN